MPIAGDDDWHLLVQGHAIDLDAINGTTINYYTQIMNYGDPEQSLPGEVATLTFTPNLVNYVHLWRMAIDWQFYWGPDMLDHNDLRWSTFAQSLNDNFITLGHPTGTYPLYLTPLTWATGWAEGDATVNDTVAHMWYGVDGRDIPRAEQLSNTKLHYYYNWRTTNTSLSVLLKDTSANGGGDAQCNAWAQYWQAQLSYQGIASSIKEIVPIKDTELMMIKNWDFVRESTTPYIDDADGVQYKYINSSSHNPEFTTSSYDFDMIYNVTDADGIAGQNKANPRASFRNHFIVLYNGTIYDPSYGKTYSSLLDFDDNAVAGYYLRMLIPRQDNTVHTVWFIRKNNLGGTAEVKYAN